MQTTLSWKIVWIVFISLCLCSTAVFSQQSREQKLDELFVVLTESKSEFEARQIEQLIWNLWFVTEDEKVDGLMRQISQAREISDHQTAWDLSNQVINLMPDYAEGWNQRATMEFMMGNYEKSLADIIETLKREPRHFGALSGRAFILLKQNKTRQAIETINQALKIHPFLGLRHVIPNTQKSEVL